MKTVSTTDRDPLTFITNVLDHLASKIFKSIYPKSVCQYKANCFTNKIPKNLTKILKFDEKQL